MPIKRMEHYLVLSDDIDETKRFYCEVLGMQEGFRPDLGFPGYWLYVGDTPCVHIAEWETYKVFTERVGIPISQRAARTGALDHIAFNASGFDETVERLEELGIEAGKNALDEIGLRQLFISDPNGLVIELNFREGRRAAVSL
ncbi:MAG TPA: VOC family protein [Gammaproteobacteria bacterium]|nr:VOC family protein [Gammaproteobacteria bacterium]